MSSTRRFSIFFAILTGIFLLIWAVYHYVANGGTDGLLALLSDREMLRNFVQKTGRLGPLIFIVIQAMQVIIAAIPGEATGFVGGFIFGLWKGFFYSSIGLVIGSLAAFWLARYFKEIIRERLSSTTWYNKLENHVEHGGLFIIFILFLLPGFPKDILCYVIGLSRLPWQVFAVMTGVGRMPGTFLLSMQGSYMYNKNYTGLIILLFFTALIFFVTMRYKERIYQWIDQHKTA